MKLFHSIKNYLPFLLVLAVLGSLIFSCSDSCKYNEADFKTFFNDLEVMNDYILEQPNLFGETNGLSLTDLEESPISGEVKRLIKNLNLIRITTYFANDEEKNGLGIAYKFDCNADSLNYTHFHYMIFVENPSNKEVFSAYEEFICYEGEAKDFSEHWLFTKKENKK